MQKGIISCRILGNTSEHSRLRDIQLGCRCSFGGILQIEVDERGSFGPVGHVAIVGRVEIHIYNLLLGVEVRCLRGQDNLFELADNRIFIADDGVFDHLLSDGAAAGHDVPVR